MYAIRSYYVCEGTAQVAGVGYVHAAGRPEEDRVGARRLGHQLVGQGRAASRACPVTRDIRLFLRNLPHISYNFV